MSEEYPEDFVVAFDELGRITDDTLYAMFRNATIGNLHLSSSDRHGFFAGVRVMFRLLSRAGLPVRETIEGRRVTQKDSLPKAITP